MQLAHIGTMPAHESTREGLDGSRLGSSRHESVQRPSFQSPRRVPQLLVCGHVARIAWPRNATMPTPPLALVLKILGPIYDPDGRVRVLRTSRDAGLKAYMDYIEAAGSTDMDPDGTIYVKIDDLRDDIKGLCLEELAHALQYMSCGNVDLGTDNKERNRRECEAAQCLLDNAEALHLSEAEREHCKKALIKYGGEHAS